MGTRLPKGRVATSSLGFGCAYLAGGHQKANSLRNVAAAMDCGYRHFDVAPAYGAGEAEDMLGIALSGRRDKVTIATKVGIARPQLSLKTRIVRQVAGPIKALVPGLARKMGQKMYQASVQYGHFDLDFVQSSIDESLRRLRTDYVDVLLLHEVRAQHLTDELLTYLDKSCRAGRFLSVGLASGYEHLATMAPEHVEAFDVLQYSWSCLDRGRSPLCQDRFHVTHRAIMNAFETVKQRLTADAILAARLSEKIGADITQDEVLSLALLGAALSNNPSGLVLAGSRQTERVKLNAKVLAEPRWTDAGRMLMEGLASAA